MYGLGNWRANVVFPLPGDPIRSTATLWVDLNSVELFTSDEDCCVELVDCSEVIRTQRLKETEGCVLEDRVLGCIGGCKFAANVVSEMRLPAPTQ